MTGLEAVIVYEFWKKTRLVSPVALHNHFNISHLDYEGRKEAMVEMAMPHLQHLTSFTNQLRQHDIADAFMMVLYHVQKHAKPVRKALAKAVDLDTFRFTL